MERKQNKKTHIFYRHDVAEKQISWTRKNSEAYISNTLLWSQDLRVSAEGNSYLKRDLFWFQSFSTFKKKKTNQNRISLRQNSATFQDIIKLFFCFFLFQLKMKARFKNDHSQIFASNQYCTHTK